MSEAESAAAAASQAGRQAAPGRVLRKARHALQSPAKVIGAARLLRWRLTRLNQIIRATAKHDGEDPVFLDHSENTFTKIVPCIGNYEIYVVRFWVLRAVNEAKSHFHGRLLDVGAGSSPYQELIMRDNQVREYIKLDFAESDYHKGNDLDLTWDGKQIPMSDGSVDTVIMTEVLEHVNKPSQLIAEVHRVLKPGGILFLTVPWLWPMHELPYDYHRFTPVALKAYLEESGFSVQQLKLHGGWDHSLAQMLGLWLTNREMGERTRKIAKLLAWPIYSTLLSRGINEHSSIRNHQMLIGLSAVAKSAV